MHTSAIQTAIDSIYEHLHEKTKVGSITFTLRYASDPQLTVCYNPKFSEDWNDDKYQSFYGDDPQTILVDAADWALAMPTRAENERQAYLERLAEAVEYGRRVGIDEVLVNPLVEAMKRLSENIITHQPEA